jgi:hypothetical protein
MVPFFLIILLMNQPSPGDAPGDHLTEMVGKNFLDQIVNKNWKRAAVLMAPTVNFDGEVVTGTKKIKDKLKAIITRHSAEIKFRRFYYFSGSVALSKFGPLPQRLKNIDLSKCSVIFGSRRKGGLIVVLQKIKEATGNWPRVVALTD